MTDRVLLDTDVFSFIMKEDTRARLYDEHLDGKIASLCFVTVAELYCWAIRHQWSAQRRDALRERVHRHSIISYDDALAWLWAQVMSLKGRPTSPSDAWIAAAALRHKLPLVTHNGGHFRHIPGLVVISEAPSD